MRRKQNTDLEALVLQLWAGLSGSMLRTILAGDIHPETLQKMEECCSMASCHRDVFFHTHKCLTRPSLLKKLTWSSVPASPTTLRHSLLLASELLIKFPRFTAQGPLLPLSANHQTQPWLRWQTWIPSKLEQSNTINLLQSQSLCSDAEATKEFASPTLTLWDQRSQQQYALVQVIVFSDISRYDLDILSKNVSFLWGIVLTRAVIAPLSLLEQEFLKKLIVVGALGKILWLVLG